MCLVPRITDNVASKQLLFDPEPRLQLHPAQQVSFQCVVCDNGEHVCCVNMDLHFILQVFRVIELKHGPQLKDL